jgi:hypothetical protein
MGSSLLVASSERIVTWPPEACAMIVDTCPFTFAGIDDDDEDGPRDDDRVDGR